MPESDAGGEDAMKTYWNKLSEEQMIKFFDFYMGVMFGKESLCGSCPAERPSKIRAVEDHSMCNILFGFIHYHDAVYYGASEYITCPCYEYDIEAFAALERCLREDGWID